MASEESQNTKPSYDCGICMDVAVDPVVTLCGHLYCWPCLNKWLEIGSKDICPICKSTISSDKVVPIYCSNSNSSTDPRVKDPPRPKAQQSESTGIFDNSEMAQNFAFSFGIGMLPFGLFTTFFYPRGRNQSNTNNHNLQQEEEDHLYDHKFFLFIGIVLLLWAYLVQ